MSQSQQRNSFLRSVTLLVAVGFVAACAGPNPRLQSETGLPATVADASAGPQVGQAAAPGAGPAQYWLPQQEQAPIYPPPEILAIPIEAIVTEPAVSYVTPQGPVSADELEIGEVPKPRRREPRPMGWVGAKPDGAKSALDLDPPSPAAAAATVTFDSLDFDDNIANTGGFIFIPPDSSGAAGPDHVVSVTNVSIQFHTKDGTELLDSVAGAPATGISLASFFAPLTPANFTFDPKVIYDQYEDRFVVVTLERTDVVLGDASDTSRILLAVSDDSDPTGAWFQTAIDSKVAISMVDHWADYPGFAVDEEAVYVTANMFEFLTSGGAFGGNRLWVIDKFAGVGGGFYGGGTATVSLFDPYAAAGFTGTTQPAHIFGTAPASPNVGTWLVLYGGLTFGGPGGLEAIQVMRLDDPVGPGTPTFVGPFTPLLADIEDIGGVFGFPPLPDAPQMGSAETIETNDRRTLHAVWRNDRLYTTTTIDPKAGDPSTGEATAHWIEVDTSTLGSPAVVDEGSIGGEDIATGTHTFFPSISVNDSDDVAIGFSASAATIFPTSAYTTRQAGDAAGTNTGSAILRSGTDYYIRTFDGAPCSATPAENRWGDYSGMSVDPFDQCFWVFNQHAITRGVGTAGGCNGRPDPEDGRWGTAFGTFCESCATNLELDSLTVSGTESEQARDNITATTVTVEATGVLTLTSAEVVLGNGFQVDAGGELTIANGPCI